MSTWPGSRYLTRECVRRGRRSVTRKGDAPAAWIASPDRPTPGGGHSVPTPSSATPTPNGDRTMIKTTHADGTVTFESFTARQKRITEAVRKYARKRGMYASLVRTCTVYFRAA